jgi:hypothetical protein
MNKELERVLREPVVYNWNYNSSTYMDELTKHSEHLSQGG